MRLALVTADSITDPSIIILGACGVVERPWAVFVVRYIGRKEWGNEFEGGDRKRNVVISDHLPTALLEGATKAEAAATRRARRNRERILLGIVVIS